MLTLVQCFTAWRPLFTSWLIYHRGSTYWVFYSTIYIPTWQRWFSVSQFDVYMGVVNSAKPGSTFYLLRYISAVFTCFSVLLHEVYITLLPLVECFTAWNIYEPSNRFSDVLHELYINVVTLVQHFDAWDCSMTIWNRK